jgi:calcineurin-like phosphoesterase family protein
VGLGDYADFINRRDPRFTVDSLADWVTIRDLGDLACAQCERFLDIVRPIAGKCLALVEGNHERAIYKHFERHIFGEIVAGIKDAGGFDADHRLSLGYTGWLVLAYHRTNKREGTRILNVNLHHGFVGGRLAGAKALNMQRWLWNHDADLVIFGHSHNTSVQVEAVERVRGSQVTYDHRIGVYAGTFMNGAQYAKEKGYMPMPKTSLEILLQPRAHNQRDRIKVLSQG